MLASPTPPQGNGEWRLERRLNRANSHQPRSSHADTSARTSCRKLSRTLTQATELSLSTTEAKTERATKTATVEENASQLAATFAGYMNREGFDVNRPVFDVDRKPSRVTIQAPQARSIYSTPASSSNGGAWPNMGPSKSLSKVGMNPESCTVDELVQHQLHAAQQALQEHHEQVIKIIRNPDLGAKDCWTVPEKVAIPRESSSRPPLRKLQSDIPRIPVQMVDDSDEKMLSSSAQHYKFTAPPPPTPGDSKANSITGTAAPLPLEWRSEDRQAHTPEREDSVIPQSSPSLPSHTSVPSSASMPMKSALSHKSKTSDYANSVVPAPVPLPSRHSSLNSGAPEAPRNAPPPMPGLVDGPTFQDPEESESSESTMNSEDVDDMEAQDTITTTLFKAGMRQTLMGNAASSFEVFEGWLLPGDLLKKSAVLATASRRNVTNEQSTATPAVIASLKGGLLTIQPQSLNRIMWDIISIILVAYDLVAIPIQLFEPPPNVFTTTLQWVTRIFWTCDIGMSMITGYLKPDGSVELRAIRITLHYARTWMFVDVSIVAVDWIEMLWEEGASLGALRMTKASRTLRIMRMLRLIRLVRIIRVNHILMDSFKRVCSERLILLAGLLKILVTILGTAHLIGCFWYGIGDLLAPTKGSGSAGHKVWVEEYDMHANSFWHRYAIALYWALTQFTGGMDEVVPQNVYERIYAICVFLLGFVTAAMATSSLTSLMMQLNMISSRQAEQMATLRKYLSQNNITARLNMRVQHNAQHMLQQQQRFMPEDNVELLQFVSEPLRIEIHSEIYSSVLEHHPLFKRISDETEKVMQKICHFAVALQVLSSGDHLFAAGEIPRSPVMYMVVAGKLIYTSLGGKECTVKEGDWLSEAALWTKWMHTGDLIVDSDCRVLLLSSYVIQGVAKQFCHMTCMIQRYAHEYVKFLNLAENECDFTDLHDEAKAKELLARAVLAQASSCSVDAQLSSKSAMKNTLVHVRRVSGIGTELARRVSQLSKPMASPINQRRSFLSVTSSPETSMRGHSNRPAFESPASIGF